MRQIDQPQTSKRFVLKDLLVGRKFRKIRLMVGVTLLVAGAVGYYFLANKPMIDQKVVNAVDFPVYAPKKSPEGYKFNPETVKLDQGTLSYVFQQDETDKRITVTVQPTPAGFNMARMIDKGSIQSSAVDNGTLYNLSTGGSSQYLLDTGDALVFLTSLGDIDTATINSLAGSLVRHAND